MFFSEATVEEEHDIILQIVGFITEEEGESGTNDTNGSGRELEQVIQDSDLFFDFILMKIESGGIDDQKTSNFFL